MNRPLLIGLLTTAAAWILYRRTAAGLRKPLPVQVAAARLRKAWANNHTVA